MAYDCFGAGQRVVALFGGSARSAAMLSAYEVVRQLHELLWYMTDALSRAAAAPVHGALADARSEIDASIAGGPSSIGSTDPEAHRAAVAPLLRRASSLTRRRAADLANRDPTGRDPTGDLPGRDSPRAGRAICPGAICPDASGRTPGRGGAIWPGAIWPDAIWPDAIWPDAIWPDAIWLGPTCRPRF